MPPEWTIEEAGAIQALARGEAQPHQQKIALAYIINKACRTYDLSYTPEGDRGTCVNEGRRFAGLHIVHLVNINLNIVKRITDGGSNSEQP